MFLHFFVSIPHRWIFLCFVSIDPVPLIHYTLSPQYTLITGMKLSWFRGIHSRISLPSVKRWLQGRTVLLRMFWMMYRSVIDVSWSKYLSKIFLLLDFLDIVRNFSSCSVENTWIRDWRKYLELKFYKDIYVSKFYRVKQFCKRLWKIWLTSCSRFGQQFQNDIVVSRIFRDARILHQFFLDSYAYVSFTQQFFQLFERLQSNEQSNILTITSNFYFFTITLTTDEQMNLKLWNEKRGTKNSCIMDYLNITITCRPKCRIKILNSILSRW